MFTTEKPERLSELHSHPVNALQMLWGVRLLPGDTVKVGDYFAALDGQWQMLTSLGHTIANEDTTYWVRMH